MSKVNIENTVEEICRPITDGLDIELIDVEYKKEGKDFVLRVIIDKPEGITIEDCEEVSRILSDRLDQVDPIENSYSLEVQSPGERSLRRESEYDYFKDRDVEVKLYEAYEGKKVYNGKLLGLNDGKVLIMIDKGNVVQFPKEKVANTRLKINF